jgi:RNA polymerase sigma factor (sigma-70 family)
VGVTVGEVHVSNDAGDLFARHYLGLVRLAVRLVDDQQTAEDVVQDVFALFARRRGDDVAEPLAYLRRAVVNRCRSVMRRRRVARAFSSHPRTAENAEAADAGTLRNVERQRMLAAIRRLPARQREVIVLRFYEDLAVSDIGAALGISAGAVSSALNRALSALAAMEKESP